MSLYLLIFLLLAAGALLEWFRPKEKEKIYLICWTASAACLCLRFGQGVDYVTYHAIYETIPTVLDLSKGYVFGFYPEAGWRILTVLFKSVHAPFWVFTAALGLADMLLLHRFLKKYVPMKTWGLFLSYPVLFITYMVSGLRQGFVICLFLGVLVPFYLEKKWVPYVLGVLVVSSFHKVGYAWLVLPAAYYLPMKWMLVLTGLSVTGGLVLQIGAVENLLVSLIPVYHLKQFLLEGEVSIFAAGERLLSFAVLLFLYEWSGKAKGQAEERTELLMKAYICGVCFYMLLFGSSYYASRYAVIFKVLEPALVAAFVKEREQIAKLGAAFFFGLALLMGCKNLNAMIQNTGYDQMSGLKIWNYPYVSVFEPDRIQQYFDYDKRFMEQYEANIGDQRLWMIEN